jgi:hypothetical protein
MKARARGSPAKTFFRRGKTGPISQKFRIFVSKLDLIDEENYDNNHDCKSSFVMRQ